MKIRENGKNNLRILLIGPLPPPIGGIATSFKFLVDSLRQYQDIEIEIVDFNDIRKQKGNAFRGLIHFCKDVISKGRQMDVITVYFATTALPSSGLLLLIISCLLRKPLIVRKGGGVDYLNLGNIKGRIAHFVVKHVELYFAETKNLVRLTLERNISHVKWFPTNRPLIDKKCLFLSEKRNCKRFVFIGQVREHKGLRVLAKATKQLPVEITVDVYGPWFDDLERTLFDSIPNISYCGVLSPDEVTKTMQRYDAFVLPSHHPGEGYPGAIFEAYAAGLPVIATKWIALPEIVDESVGILVEPKDADDLCQAMLRLYNDAPLYKKLRLKTQEKAQFFSSDYWTREFVKNCREVVKKEKGSSD